MRESHVDVFCTVSIEHIPTTVACGEAFERGEGKMTEMRRLAMLPSDELPLIPVASISCSDIDSFRASNKFHVPTELGRPEKRSMRPLSTAPPPRKVVPVKPTTRECSRVQERTLPVMSWTTHAKRISGPDIHTRDHILDLVAATVVVVVSYLTLS